MIFVYDGHRAERPPADALRIISVEAANERCDLRSIHIPQTIDNDLAESDHAPGFPSAARFVAQALIGADLDNRSPAGVYLGVVMGRRSGFLTAASAAARVMEDDGPHLIYLPERSVDEAKFLSEVEAVYDRLGRCVTAISEGVTDACGTSPLEARRPVRAGRLRQSPNVRQRRPRRPPARRDQVQAEDRTGPW